LARGDVIRFGENLSHLNIRNGNRARITEIDRDRHGGARIAFRLEDGRQVDVHWQELSGERRGKKPLPPRIVHAYAGTVYSVQGRTAAASVVYVSSPTDAREIYVGLTRHTEDARLVIESERLDAICRQRQTDSRMKPTSADLRDRLFREAMQYREKANVVDYCADRSEFVTTGTIDLPHVDSQKSLVARAVFASRSLRQALTWPEPARLVAPVWRLVEQGRKLTRDLPPELAAVVRAARDRMWLARDRAGRGPSYDR